MGGNIFGYEIQIDTVDKKVYLVSGDVRISVDNVEEYFAVDNPSALTGTSPDREANSGTGAVVIGSGDVS